MKGCGIDWGLYLPYYAVTFYGYRKLEEKMVDPDSKQHGYLGIESEFHI